MYAVVKFQGRQMRLEPEATIEVPRLQTPVGERLEIREVLAVGDEGSIEIGRPLVEGAVVEAEVIEHHRAPVIRVVKFKRRKDYRRRFGHRSALTRLKIHDVRGPGA